MDQVCRAKSCVQPAGDGACTSDDECIRGQVCTSNQCTPIGDDPDAGDNNGGNNGDPDTGDNNGEPDTGNNGEPDMPIDEVPPEIVSVSPAEGMTDVALDADVVITFSEPVREFGLANKIVVANVDTNETLRLTARIADSVVTLDPEEGFVEGTPYQVIITTEISDEAGNTLRDEYRWFFSTAIQEDAGHRALALKYAPVIHQEIDDDNGIAKSDVFTNVDFDGNFNANDNIDTYFRQALQAYAYYAVVETVTHYYIQYMFYYPASYNSNNQEYHAHDITATQVVVAKGDEERFVMAETGYGPQATLYWGFAVEGEDIRDRNQGQLEHTFGTDELWRGTHYRQYNGDQFHGGCHWTWEPPFNVVTLAPWCNHLSGEFNNPTDSIVFYPGETAQGPSDLACTPDNDADCFQDLGIACDVDTCKDEGGQRATTYELIDFRSNLWVRRAAISGDDRTFLSSRREYRPHASSGQRPGSGTRVPVGLFTEDDRGRGAVPFVWSSEGSVSEGQWWLDPAYTFQERFRFGENNDAVSDLYCFHPWFNIDMRGTEGCE